MASFVSIVAGILFCTTFWDKPKAKALSFIQKKSKVHVALFRAKIASNPNTAAVYDDVACDILDNEVDEQVTKLKQAVEGKIEPLYVVLACLFGSLGLVELFFSLTGFIGCWNALILAPIVTYLLLSLLAYCCLRFRIWRKKRDYEGYIKVNLRKAQKQVEKNKKEVDSLVPELPPDKGEKQSEQ